MPTSSRSSAHDAHIFPPAAPHPSVRALWERWRTLLGEVRPPGTGLVLEVDGAVAGSVAAGTEPDEPGAGHVSGLYVHPDRWGGGDGVRLLDAAMDRLRAAGCPEVTLWVLRGNGGPAPCASDGGGGRTAGPGRADGTGRGGTALPPPAVARRADRAGVSELASEPTSTAPPPERQRRLFIGAHTCGMVEEAHDLRVDQ